jgi:hypothetical protein
MADKAMSTMGIDSSLDGTERILAQGADGSIILLSAISTYTLANLLAATSNTSVTDSDEFLIERSGAAIKVDEQYIRSRILGKAFDSSDGSAAQAGDLILIERSGAIYTLDVDDIVTYVGSLSSLDISGLGDATLGSGVYLLIGEGSTPTKTTLGSLETQLWADFDAYLTELGSVATLTDSDAFYVLDNGVPQKITASTIATYIATNNATDIIAAAYDDVDPIGSLTSGDEFICETSDVPKTATIDNIDTYVQTSIAGTSNTATSFTGTDEIYLERSDAIYKIDVDYLTDYVVQSAFDNATNVPVVTSLDTGDDILLGRGTDTVKQITWENLAGGIQSTILTHSGLTECSDPQSTDTFIIGDAGTPKKVPFSDIETTLWADWQTYFTGLGAVSSVLATDKIPLNQGGTAYHITPALLATYVESAISSNFIGDVFGGTPASPIATGDIVGVERSGVLKKANVTEFADYSIETLFGKGALDPIASGDDLAVYRSDVAYTADVDDISAYAISTIWDSDTQTTLASADMFHFDRGGTSYQIDIDNMVTHVLAGVQTSSLDISGLTPATLTKSSGDQYLVVQSGVAKRTDYVTLAEDIHEDFKAYTLGLGDIVTLADGDEFYVHDADTSLAKRSTAKEMCTYVDLEIWSTATELETLIDTDTFLMRKGGTTYYTTFSTLASEVSDGLQATILDLTGLGNATLSTGDFFLVGDGATAQKCTASALTTYSLGQLSTYVSGKSTITTVADDDIFYCIQGGVDKHVTPEELASYFYDEIVEDFETLDAKTDLARTDTVLIQDSESGGVLKRAAIGEIILDTTSGWAEISTDSYTATPPGTSGISMSDTSDMAVGLPLKYTYSAVDYYGIITAVTENASIVIAGAPLNISHSITGLYVGPASKVRQEEFFIDSIYDDAVQDCLAEVAERNYKWQLGDAYLVSFSAVNHWPDSGATQPYVNVKVGGSLVSTASTNQGMQVSATEDTWTDNTVFAINTSNYKIERGDAVEIACTATGTNGDAECLTVSCLFVFEG